MSGSVELTIPRSRLLQFPIELNLAATGLPNMDFLSKSDPFAVVFVRPASGASGWQRLGKTEIIWDDLNPRWCSSFILPKIDEFNDISADLSASTASFSSAIAPNLEHSMSVTSTLTHTSLRVDVYDWDKDTDDLTAQDFIGRAEATYGDLFDAPGHHISVDLKDPKKRGKDRGKLQLVLDTITRPSSPLSITFQISATTPLLSNKKSCFIVSKLLLNNVWTPVYRSENVKEKAPKFKEFTLSLENLSAGKEDRSFRVEMYKVKRNAALDKVGFFLTSLKTLRGYSPGAKLQWWSPNAGLQLGGAVCVSSSCLDRTLSFGINVPG